MYGRLAAKWQRHGTMDICLKNGIQFCVRNQKLSSETCGMLIDHFKWLGGRWQELEVVVVEGPSDTMCHKTDTNPLHHYI